MKILRFIAILISFALEVRVKALQQEPLNCLNHIQQECALLSLKPSVLKTSSFSLEMQKEGILFRNQNRIWNLVSGVLRVQNTKKIQLEAQGGRVLLHPGGVYWLKSSSDNKLWIVVLKGRAELHLLSNVLVQNNLLEGFFNWYGDLNYQNFNQQGIPRAIELPRLVKLIPELRTHRDRTLIEKMTSRSLAQASHFYGEVVQTMERTAWQKKVNLEKRRLLRLQREKAIRDLFRQKYFGPIDFSDPIEGDDN